MTRIATMAALAASLLLGACNVVITNAPLLSEADQAGAPRPKPGLWRFDSDPDCKFDEAKPLVDWPKCAGGAVIGESKASFYDRGGEAPVWTTQPIVLAAGTPRIGQVQAAISGDVKVTSNPYLYAGARATKLDDQGRIVALVLWPVQCGPPPPDDAKSMGGTKAPLPGLEMKPGDPVCTTASIPALRAAAKASEAWAPKLLAARWLRDGP